MKITYDIKGVENRYKKLIEASIADMEVVLSSEEFAKAFAEEVAYSNNLEGELSKWRKKTTPEILDYLLKTPIKLEIKTYYTSRRVIGYGLASDDLIRVNTKYLSQYTVDDPWDRMEVGSNLCHEHSHNIGFDHDFERTRRRKNSLSYLLNDAYKAAYQKVIIKKAVPPVWPVKTYKKKPWWKRLFGG